MITFELKENDFIYCKSRSEMNSYIKELISLKYGFTVEVDALRIKIISEPERK